MKVYNIEIGPVNYYYYASDEATNPSGYANFIKHRDERIALCEKHGLTFDTYHEHHSVKGMVDETTLIQLYRDKVEFEIKEEKDFSPAANTTMHEAAQTVTDKAYNVAPTGVVYNELVQVHMPGQALSTYNEVLLLEGEDSCSDNLQTHLNTGWRIIAACPQPDARRPDYILGRFNPEFVVDGRARRPAYR